MTTSHRARTRLSPAFISALALVALASKPAYARLGAEPKPNPPIWEETPGQRLVRSDCIYRLPSGAHIESGPTGEDISVNGSHWGHNDPCPEAPRLAGSGG